jgi:O-acetyl-ADP-ribose deacetylase (regulator of RNase III)
MKHGLAPRLYYSYVRGDRSPQATVSPIDPVLYYVKGNLFESPAQAIVNTVNTEGVMGKGIALQFKKYYPEMFAEYQQMCDAGKLKIGTLHIYRTPRKVILNFPTKTIWRRPSSLAYIEAGLRTFVEHYQRLGIHSVAFPPLGCGNGELSYDDVRPIMESYLSKLPIPIYLYPPIPRDSIAEHRTPKVIGDWLRSEPRSMPFGEVWRDLRDVLATPRQFETLTKRTPFTVEYVEDESDPQIRVRAAGKISAFTKADVKVIWQDLRTHGMATTRSADARHTAYLFPLLAALPYIDVVRIADSYEKFNFTQSSALQLVATATGSEQPSLAFG